jgi:hypothetical protein
MEGESVSTYYVCIGSYKGSGGIAPPLVNLTLNGGES